MEETPVKITKNGHVVEEVESLSRKSAVLETPKIAEKIENSEVVAAPNLDSTLQMEDLSEHSEKYEKVENSEKRLSEKSKTSTENTEEINSLHEVSYQDCFEIIKVIFMILIFRMISFLCLDKSISIKYFFT